MSTDERRAALLEWISSLPDREGMTAPEIARRAVAWTPPNPQVIYSGEGFANCCYDDLCALARDGKLRRGAGRPVTWWTQ
jgi:hypothetical protein